MNSTIKHSLSELTDLSLCDLSIHAGHDGFLFFAENCETGKIIFRQQFRFFTENTNILVRKIREIIENHKVLRGSYRTTTVYLAESNFSLIPEPFFSEKIANYPLSLRQKSERETIVLPLHYLDAFLIFNTGNHLIGFFSETFPGCLISHEISPVIHRLKNNFTSFINFHIHSSWFYSIAMINNKIDMVNTFEYRNDEDLVFFILTVINHYDPDNVPVLISGWDDEIESNYQLIRKFVSGSEKFQFYPDSK